MENKALEKLIDIQIAYIKANENNVCIKKSCDGCDNYHSCTYDKKFLYDLEVLKDSLGVREIMAKFTTCHLCNSLDKNCMICGGKMVLKKEEIDESN